MRKFGAPYLNRDFFALMHERMRDEVLLVLARDDGEWIAGAINFIGPDTLFGRNWGSQMPSKFAYRFLHFEACYYQAIDFAIQRGLTRVEAGAQGEHKIQRGYLPTPTYSAHWIRHPQFRQAVADFLRRETRAVERDMEVLTEHSPFKRAQG
jgi:predicted N-acyltransferase